MTPGYPQKGFTLIELMVVVVIIAIISLIAYPSYTKQVKDSRRAEYEGKLMKLSATLENYRARNFSYEGATVTNQASDLSNSKYYSANITLANNNQSYTITATPKGAMAGDGVLKLNSKGQTCHVEGADCNLSSNSSWNQD